MVVKMAGLGASFGGVAATGRNLEKPVCHYSLNWAKDEKPERQGGGVEPQQAETLGPPAACWP